MGPCDPVRFRGRRDQLLIALVDGCVVLGHVIGNIAIRAICAALCADGQGIERTRLGARGEDANRVKKGSERVQSRQHRSLALKSRTAKLVTGESSILGRRTPGCRYALNSSIA